MAKDKKRYKRRGRRSKTRGFASWSLGKKIGAILGGTLVTVAAIGAVIVASKLSKINTVKLDTDKLSVSKEAKKTLHCLVWIQETMIWIKELEVIQ